ncbi:MAG TPA: energy transducer TonB [Candidatus Acidoferrum sp.]|nr:energy transducer TonB [Candidatus Acidoferrum sp.]
MTTMLADPPRKTTMGVGFDANRRAGDPQAWKKAIGSRPVPARLAMLPESKPRWDRIGISAGAQVAILVFVLMIPLVFPQQMKTALHYQIVELMQPVTEIPVAPPPPPPPKIKPKITPTPKPEVPEPVKLNPKQPHVFLTAKVLQPKVQTVEAKPVELNPAFDAVKFEMKTNEPKRPKEDVKVGNLSTGSAATPTIKTPVDVSKVQTGGFGDPNGVPGKGDPNKATNVNRAGLPTLPGGPGYGNGTGGDKGMRGTVASTGFGNGVATPPPAPAKHGSVQSTGFADQTAVTDAPKKKAASADSGTTPVDILDKPHPEYTAEGRNLKIEGDVVLDMVFLANGSIQVNKVISGLGHGLDEAAVKAAQQIKFKPAKRDGQAVDFPARVRIEFRLAY